MQLANWPFNKITLFPRRLLDLKRAFKIWTAIYTFHLVRQSFIRLMRTQNGRRGYCTKFIQLIQSAWAESHASTTIFHDMNIAVLAQLSAHSDWIRAVCIWRNILVFHFYILFYIQFIILWYVHLSLSSIFCYGNYYAVSLDQRLFLN